MPYVKMCAAPPSDQVFGYTERSDQMAAETVLFTELEDHLQDWCVRIEANGGDISLVRLIENLKAIELVDGLFVVEWMGNGSDSGHVHRSLDTLHTQITTSTYGMIWPADVGAFHLLGGRRGHMNGGRGYISRFNRLSNLTSENMPSDERKSAQISSGVANQMNEQVIEGEAYCSGLTPLELSLEEFVGTAAEVLSVMEWSLRGLSTNRPSDACARSILSFCFLALKPCNPLSYARYMNYTSFHAIETDAARGYHLMKENSEDAKRCRLLLSELSGLHLNGIEVSIDDVKLPSDFGSDNTAAQNVVSLKEYKEGLGEDQIMKGISDLLMKST